jgi:hypothetical protein
MYKLQIEPKTGELTKFVQRLADGAWIPFDPDNTDYQEYLRWLEAGNTPEPAEEQQ